MPALREYSAALGRLESFDPAAFIGSKDAPQEVCNFVLALALIHNDHKNIVLGHALLDEVQPPDPTRITADRGEHAGLKVHLIRLHASLISELCQLIRKESRVIDHPVFRAVIKKLDELARSDWQALIDAANAEPSENPFVKALVLLRNNVAFSLRP